MKFPKCDETPLGIYPVVDRADKLTPLYECGITTAQLRVKDMEGEALEAEIIKGVNISKRYQARFFINDYWQLAIKHNAYGVHLGQEDIQGASMEIEAIYAAGLRLGISSHTPEEIEIALLFKPSYLAIGPIYEPISKKMSYKDVGPEKLKQWAKHVECPIVAIGGITEKNIIDVVAIGVTSGIAMISAVLENGSISRKKTEILMKIFEYYDK
ncbi:MAG: thiamine phosphate synthase [Sulfurovum sp.]|nr:thiamine phosphate synthase [Sulfurovum sp.]MCB4745256.1 thiamine phosphate synthase [Sulfurovum sp.]MCB4746746.1 thiamine phosphate synthase [Sulfurovum sp.]MCB4747618.1 thiamine phosphate synthase [Sulfurovum sp.]MCB4749330.1 thiamine phosphate synthase [Sulfurovum sp.]